MDNDKLTLAITKALAYTENGGKPDLNNLKAGKTGEMKSIFQIVPDTWKLYSKQVTGHKDLPLNPETEVAVVHSKVSNWVNHLKEEGVSDEEIPLKIASMWNAGEGKQNAYKENFKGINKKYGVAYDTPAYAKKVANYTKEFSKDIGGGIPSQSVETANTTPQVQSNGVPGVLSRGKAEIAPKANPGLIS